MPNLFLLNYYPHVNFHIAKICFWAIHWLNKVIECSIHECSLNGKDNDLSYYLIYFGPFCTGPLCLFPLFP